MVPGHPQRKPLGKKILTPNPITGHGTTFVKLDHQTGEPIPSMVQSWRDRLAAVASAVRKAHNAAGRPIAGRHLTRQIINARGASEESFVARQLDTHYNGIRGPRIAKKDQLRNREKE